jgi:hypothetical protein
MKEDMSKAPENLNQERKPMRLICGNGDQDNSHSADRRAQQESPDGIQFRASSDHKDLMHKMESQRRLRQPRLSRERPPVAAYKMIAGQRRRNSQGFGTWLQLGIVERSLVRRQVSAKAQAIGTSARRVRFL